MKYGIVYIVVSEDGEIAYASTDRDEAKGYEDEKNFEGRGRAFDKLGIDEDACEKDIIEADIQASIDGDYYDVVEVDISNKTGDDIIETDIGDFDVYDILEELKKNK